MKRFIALVLISCFLFSGCANLGGLIGLAASGYAIYKAVTSD